MINLTDKFSDKLCEATGYPTTGIASIVFNGDLFNFYGAGGIFTVKLKSGESIDVRYPSEIHLLKAWLKSKSGADAWGKVKTATISKDGESYKVQIGGVEQEFPTQSAMLKYLQKITG